MTGQATSDGAGQLPQVGHAVAVGEAVGVGVRRPGAGGDHDGVAAPLLARGLELGRDVLWIRIVGKYLGMKEI